MIVFMIVFMNVSAGARAHAAGRTRRGALAPGSAAPRELRAAGGGCTSCWAAGSSYRELLLRDRGVLNPDRH